MTSTPAADYTPRAGSLPALVCNYMATRPDVPNLDAETIADLFGVAQSGIHTQLGKAVDAGLLKRTDSSVHGIVYTATPKLRQNAVSQAMATQPAAARSTATKSGRTLVDLHALPVETSVPAPVGRTSSRFDYARVLDRLAPPAGKNPHSFLIPGNAVGLHPLKKVITQRNKAGTHRYALRTEPSGAVRVWRMA